MNPLSNKTLHLAIDMQRLFAESTPWATPALLDILPAVLRLTEARPTRTLFPRFTVPARAEMAVGRWRTYYRRWHAVTGDRLDAGLLDLVEPLAALATPHTLIDKTTYSVFDAPGFPERLEAEGVDTLVMSGVETDVCVLASVFDAIDRGYRVVLPRDALASSSAAAHEAVLDVVLSRLTEQVEITSVAEVLDAWRS